MHESKDDVRNGTKYELKLRYPNGVVDAKTLFLTLVDAATFEPIRYEGLDANEQMQRVLLTHEVICSRCRMSKSCGNNSEAPSHPRIVSQGELQFFLKCNQNCLKGAGNPRDMRRFAVAVSFEDIVHKNGKVVALSEKIFVHNNSKHSRKRKREADKPEDIPHIFPRVGRIGTSFSFHSKRWSKHGTTFRCQYMPLPVSSVIENMAMTVELPETLNTRIIYITMYSNDSPIFTFPYYIEVNMCPQALKRTTRGYLFLVGQDKNGCELNLGPDHQKVVVSEGDNAAFFYHNNDYAPDPFSYAPNQNFSSSSGSSYSPDGSQLSVGSNSSPTYPPFVSY